MKEETIEQIEYRLEEMKKLQAENPTARVVYNTLDKSIEVIFPIPKTPVVDVAPPLTSIKWF